MSATTKSTIGTKEVYRMRIVWKNVIIMLALHVSGLYGLYSALRYSCWKSFVWGYFVGYFASFGILAGAHRLWSHRSYKAHFSLRVLLMIMQTMALQNDIYEWCRDHRVHHKYSETDADPHNAKRGFFFSHIGWLLVRKHPEVTEKGRSVDMSDVWADPIVRFQRKFYVPLVILLWGVIPTIVPVYFWNESLLIAIFGNLFRYLLSLHHSWLVNSAAHMFGNRPYDSQIGPRENSLVVYMSIGEGYHNFHHTFPWDYSASEFGWRVNFNLGTAFIDFFAWLGLAYDLRMASDKIISNRVNRTGNPKCERKPINRIINMLFGFTLMSWQLLLSVIIVCSINWFDWTEIHTKTSTRSQLWFNGTHTVSPAIQLF